MNWIDIIIAIPVIWFAFKGFKNGLIKEFATLAALLLGIWLASEFSYYIAGIIKQKTEISENYIPIIAFAIVFIVVVILVHLLAKSLDSLVKAIALEWLNKIAGIALGAVKAVLIIAVLVYLTNEFLIAKWELINEETVKDSVLFQPVLDFIKWIYPKLTELDIHDISLKT